MPVKSNEIFAVGIVVFVAGLVASLTLYNAATTGRLDTLVIGFFCLAIILVQLWVLQRARHRTGPPTRRERNLADRRGFLLVSPLLAIALVALVYEIWIRADQGAPASDLVFLSLVAIFTGAVEVGILLLVRAIGLNPDREFRWSRARTR